MAYWKLVTAEEPKHAIEASLRGGGTMGERANQGDTLDKGSEGVFFAGSIGRKWLGDFGTRRPGGPKGVILAGYALSAKEFGSKALALRGPTDHLAFCPRP